jgi:hypothetical protein
MRKITRNLLAAGGLALSIGAVAAPASADFRLGINVAPVPYGYYYAPPPTYYYYYSPYW